MIGKLARQPVQAAFTGHHAYARLGQPLAVYGHIHVPFVRSVSGMTVVNSGSVSLSHDGDSRAAYLIVDDWRPHIRRVDYDVQREIKALHDRRYPHAVWIVKMLETALPQMA